MDFYFFCGIVYMLGILSFVMAILLFLRYRSGDFPRRILAFLFVLSAGTALFRFIGLIIEGNYHISCFC
jgi:hypothetical protein